MIGEYWVGQIPAQPMAITVKDDKGFALDLTPYTSIILKMVDGNNAPIDTSAGSLAVLNARQGRLTYHWPNKSIFTRPGSYLMQLELAGTGVKDITRTVPLMVRRFGGRYVRNSG